MREPIFAGLSGIAAPMLLSTAALAHGVAGDRFFPTTLAVDDPAVADELTLPTIAILKNADGARQVDLSFEYSKRITELFGISVADTYSRIRPGGGGFGNLETTFKYQAVTDASHEFILSAGLAVEWANTGARSIGAENFTTFTPTIWFGKGFGDLPARLDWVRPFAVTGQLGYAIPSSAKRVTFTGLDEETGLPGFDIDRHPRYLVGGAALQYSLPYLKASVVDLGLPDFVNHLIPIVEATFKVPVSNNFNRERTTGTINPGVIWAGQKFQVGLEALIPVNRASGRNVGFLGQIHFYLDDIFPNSIGRPLFAKGAP